MAARGKVEGMVKLYVEDEVEVEVRQNLAGTAAGGSCGDGKDIHQGRLVTG